MSPNATIAWTDPLLADTTALRHFRCEPSGDQAGAEWCWFDFPPPANGEAALRLTLGKLRGTDATGQLGWVVENAERYP
jgi:hypothetical protein